MKKEQAIRIARNLLAQTSYIEIADMKVKRMEPAGGMITVTFTAENEDGENDHFEVEIDPTTNALALKKVEKTYSLDEYLNESTTLSKLRPGQLFRLKFDCVVYEYYRTAPASNGDKIFFFTRQGQREIMHLFSDKEVYPIG